MLIVKTKFSKLKNSASRLWDLETLGIREENEVHEALKDAISFNGERYEVSLPWKEGHEPLPTNYRNSLKRLTGQIERLKNDSEILKAYDAVIKEQAVLGIIEKVSELEMPGNIHSASSSYALRSHVRKHQPPE